MALDEITPRLEIILQKIAKALSPTPGKIFLNPGVEAPWDNCCEDGGQAWVRVQSIEPMQQATVTSGKPRADGSANIVAWTVTIGVGVVRCVHTIDDHGVFPTGAEMSQDAEQMLKDEAAIRQTLICEIAPRSMIQWVPLGALGGCAGGEWTATILVPNCACSD